MSVRYRRVLPTRGCGGIGRRAAFRSPCPSGRGGSSPLIRIPSEPKSSDSTVEPTSACRSEAAVSAGSAVPKRRAVHIWLVSDPARSVCAAGGPRHPHSAHATLRALNRPPPGSRAHADDVPDRAASRRGNEPKMLQILVRVSPRKFLIRREHRAQCIEHVLPCLLSRAALAESSWDLQHTRDDPTCLVWLVEGDREVDRGHRHTVAPCM